ncbi:pre-peptidase C-terminal domain-containing protein [Chlorogloeopsis sp. ULAP01]|uniref:PPC domain-containing protein n=1 Tax=Chlorogloeopsis sp. ULAP01 TaxID=3056483 RepID=UPI0025AA60E0|nr:pre-peptidase C-terminal domain-containing protein [Chlorogloeopsis sp. ULAP01]MDM9380796.1 pre-peptidase C-terminal domain-containing protein [Chlorogloeopsis sp. ULAP01]
MAREINTKLRSRFNLALIFSISSSLLITSYIPSIYALEVAKQSGEFKIAKTPDERQPEAVQQGIEQIPVSQPPVSPLKRNQPINSPIPATQAPPTESTSTSQSPGTDSTPAPSPTTESTPTPQPPSTGSTPAPSPIIESTPTPQPPSTGSTPSSPPASQPSNRRSTPSRSQPASQPSNRRSTPSRSQPVSQPSNRRSTPSRSQPVSQPSNRRSTPSRSPASKPTTKPNVNNNQISVGSPVNRSTIPNAKKVDFVNIALGVLAPGDFKSQGRYFHFYQFEGRENQLIQIRLTGSADQRRSSNLSLDPFMMLLDPNNRVLTKRGNGETASKGGVKDAFIFVRLPVKGTYTIAVTSRNPGEIGRYSLALRNDRASYALDESGNLTASNLSFRKTGSPYSISKFEGKKDQLVSIRVDSMFEEFPPYIVLLNSKGQIVATDNDKDGRYTALIDRAKLPENDTYYVVILSATPREKGAYRLTVF